MRREFHVRFCESGGVRFPSATRLVILSRGHAEEALAWTQWVMDRMKLTLNATKTCIRNARRESFDFLGYTFGPQRYPRTGSWYLSAQPSKKSVQRLKAKVHTILHRGNVAPWPGVVEQVNRMLRGWSNYFCHGTLRIAYRAIDNYVYDRAVRFLKKRHKVSSRGTRKFSGDRLFGELGIQRLRALAYARRSCALT